MFVFVMIVVWFGGFEEGRKRDLRWVNLEGVEKFFCSDK